MAVIDLIIKDCDVRFATMLNNIHKMYAKGIRCQIEISLSGGQPNQFNYIFQKVDPETLMRILDKNKKEI